MKVFVLTLYLCGSLFAAKAQNKEGTVASSAPKVVFQNCLDKPLVPDFYKGKFLVLDFWATWCAPCIAGFPDFNGLADKYSNNNVVFASYSVEPISTLREFFTRTQKQLHALKLSDTTDITRKALNIYSYPSCVIIGPDNTIRWQGETFQLTADILDEVIVKKQNLFNPVPSHFNTPAAISDKKKRPAHALMRFNIAEADTDKKITEWNRSFGSMADGTITSYRVEKVELKHFLQDITGFSSNSRILTNDSIRLSKAYNLDYNIGSDTSRYNRYSNRVLKSSPFTNYTLSVIGDILKFNAVLGKKNINHYNLVINDTARLHTFKSMSKHQSFSDDYPPKIESVGYPLKDVIMHAEYRTKTIITLDGVNDNERYDLSLDAGSIESLKKSLAFYGLTLKKADNEVEFLSINFY
jgi:thiol-disulfide isomerase/thioredoxin